MNDQQYITTQAGLDELLQELEERKTKTRDKIADEIARARDQGDLSENAAYSAAMESKQFNETRIIELEEIIAKAVVKKVNTSDKKAGIGEKVNVIRLNDNREMEFILVGENEADPSIHKISIKSPIGKALLGKKVGDVVEVLLPTGKIEFKIKSV